MYVTCPSCHSLYSLNAEHLRLAAGRVRCSGCGTVFDARAAIFDDRQQALDHQHRLEPDVVDEIDALVGRALENVPGDSDQSVSAVPEEAEPAGAAVDFVEERVEEEGAEDAEAALQEVGEVLSAGVLQADVDHYAQPVAGEFVSASGDERVQEEDDLSAALLFEEPIAGPSTAWGAIAAAFLLTFALLIQYAYVERYRLFDIAAVRPALLWGCQYLPCHLPLLRDLAQVEMIEREVRDHPHVGDALLINAKFANRAGFVQAYPTLQIAFSDFSGTPVAVRRFSPAEYLRQGDVDRGMQPGEQTLVMLEVVDPGETAVSFQFDFM